MVNKLVSLFSKEVKIFLNNWTENKHLFKRYWIFVLVLILIGFFGMYLTLHILNVDLKHATNKFGAISKVESTITDKDSYWKGTIQLFRNNWKVCLQIFILSFIPIPFLYSVSIIGSSLLLGVALGLFQKTGANIFAGILFGVLPHSILELSVFIVATIYGAKINKIIVGKILNKFRRNKQALPLLRRNLKESFFVLIFVITPFIFIAAIIEGYISRFLLLN